MKPRKILQISGAMGVGILLLFILIHSQTIMNPSGRASDETPEAAKSPIVDSYGKLPLSFEANQGQTDSRVKFLSRGKGYTLFLSPTEAVLSLKSAESETSEEMNIQPAMADAGDTQAAANAVLRMHLLGANPEPRVAGLDELPGKSNYFIGNDLENWHTDVPNYARVHYDDVYPGVDLVFYGNQRQLEYDFVVSPGADPAAIRLGFKGADDLSFDDVGNLTLHMAEGDVLQKAPIVYQEVDGVRRAISGSYVLQGKDQVGFQIAAYDADRPLIIDPILSYSTYLGGSGDDGSRGIAVDASGSAYVTGSTSSVDFPTGGAFDVTLGGTEDAFVTKLNATGSAIVYSTYLGGSGTDGGGDIAVDASGNAYVAGFTNSTDLPTLNPFQAAYGGGSSDAFVTKLNATGSALVYSTYLGGSRAELGLDIAIDWKRIRDGPNHFA